MKLIVFAFCLQSNRFKTYSALLRAKIASVMYHATDLEPSLVETAISEVNEPPSPNTEHKDGMTSPPPVGAVVKRHASDDRRVTRHVTDRHSYRSAINTTFSS